MNKFFEKLGKLKVGKRTANQTRGKIGVDKPIKRKQLRNDIIGLAVLGLSSFAVAFYFGRGLLGAEEETGAMPVTPTMTSVSTDADFPAGVANVRITVTTDIDAACAIGTELNPTKNMTTTGGTTHSEVIPTPIPGVYSRFIRCRAGSGSTWGEWSTEEVATARICSGPIATNGTVMQTITDPCQCPTTRVWAVDARDNRTYWIRRIPNTASGGGDLCWMETNLAYEGSGTNTHGDTMNLTVRNTGQGAWDVAPANGAPFVRTEGFSSFTTNPTPPGSTQRGFFYNWCAAMGGPTVNPQACNDTQSNQALIHQTANLGAGHNQNATVCPKNWRLPRTTTQGTAAAPNSNLNEFWNLNQSQNSGLTNTDEGLRTNWLAIRLGSVCWDGTFDCMNTSMFGFYWSSTTNPTQTSSAFTLRFSSNSPNVSFGTPGKAIGNPIRCVLQ